MSPFTRTLLAAVLVSAVLTGLVLTRDADFSPPTPPAPADPVTLMRTPNGGIQPQVAVDASGRLHLVYFTGDPAHGDLFYTRQNQQGAWSAPIRVNSEPESAVATGTVRGGHIAIGRAGLVHVAWLGSARTKASSGNGGTPILYARFDEARARFEPERNVAQVTPVLDGGALAADAEGRVAVVWHAARPGMTGEDHRAVWMARSSDDGATFAPGVPVSPAASGACGCCGMAALADTRGSQYVLFRSAPDIMERDATLLRFPNGAAAPEAVTLQPWRIGGCPMSTFSLAETPLGVLAAWETNGQVQWLRIDPRTGQRSAIVAAPGVAKTRKHPAIAGTSGGETLLAWTEDTAWNQGGRLAWQRFDRDDRPIGSTGSAPDVPAWGLPAVAPRPDGGFVVIY